VAASGVGGSAGVGGRREGGCGETRA